jgi:hypothetical protein
MILLRIFN